MNITVTKVIDKMEKEYGWGAIPKHQHVFVSSVVADTLRIVNDLLKEHKGISIRKNKH